jgi:hypothetical protein
VSFIVLCGSATSNLVCYAIWPQSATSALQANMTKTLDSFSTLLSLLTNAFLLEEGLQQPSHERLMKAVANHQSSFTSLKKNLKEAQSEWVKGSGGAPGGGLGRAYEDAVDSMTRLAQHLNGLRGGTRLQYDLTKAGVVGKSKKAAHGNGKQKADHVSIVFEDEEEAAMLNAAAEMFGDLVDELGPPLKALSVCAIGFSTAVVINRRRRRRAPRRSCGCASPSSSPSAEANAIYSSSTSFWNSSTGSSARWCGSRAPPTTPFCGYTVGAPPPR